MVDDEEEVAIRRMIDVGHVSASVGHYLINAFSAVVSNAELLRLDPPMPSIADPVVIADTIIRASLDASTVARNLIDYLRPVTSIDPAQRPAFQPDLLALDEFVGRYIEERQCKGGPSIQWELDLTPVGAIHADPTQLRTMLDHLVDNAVESFSPEGGVIRFSTTSDRRGWCVLEIQDDGQGMEATTLERAVEPFFSTKPGHLGVGLSIANGIWRRHRGTLSVQSRPGEGTKLRLAVESSRN